MNFNEIVVKESPGLCRCCLSEGCYKDLSSEYTWMNESEVYADMLLECFDISISQQNEGPDGSQRLVCEVCITRLRDACNFKKQVMDSEKKFVDMLGRGEFRPKVVVYQSDMKVEENAEVMASDNEAEVEYLEDDADYVTELLKTENSMFEEATRQEMPAKAKRGRPRKNPSSKPEKKTKVVKASKSDVRIKKAIKGDTISNDADRFERLKEIKRKDDLTKFLTTILENSTAMPFRWQGNKYLCFFCCCPFNESTKLKTHTREEHENPKLRNFLRSLIGSTSIKLDISDISCKRCKEPTRNVEDFLRHVSEHHGLKYNSALSNNLFEFKLSDSGMMCLDCGSRYRFFGPLLMHVHKYHGKSKLYLCEICGQGFIAKSNVNSHKKNVHSNATKTCQCEKCDKIFASHYLLTQHNEKVHMVEKLKCPKCPEILGSRYLKKRHLALVHDVESAQFKCDKCPKIFTLHNKLVQHTNRVHLREKSLACNVCGFKVFNRDTLRSHMITHNDSRPYQCEFCKKSFSRKKTLEFHRRIHTNDRRYVCKECGKAFVQVTSLKLHVRVHHSANESGNWT